MANEKRIEVTYDPGASLEVLILDQETGYILDDTDGEFRAAPTDDRVAIPEHTTGNGFDYDVPGLYVLLEDRAAWLNGAKTIIVYEVGGNVPVRSTTMNITNDADEAAVAGTGFFTYQQVIDDANVKLRNQESQNWDATQFLSLLNDAVQIALHAAAFMDPDQFALSSSIALTVAGGHGPYDLPNDLKYDLFVEDDQTVPQRLDKINRSASKHVSGTGRPTGYWLQGRSPAKIYFDLTPDASRTFTVWYIPIVARASSAGVTGYVPLEAYFFEPLVQWLCKFAGQMDEYITMDEDQKIQFMTALLGQIMVTRASAPEINISGVGF